MTRIARSLAVLALAAVAACGGAREQLAQARDLALSGHHSAALLEARAMLFALPDSRDEKTDELRRGGLKLAGDLCALHLDDPRCAASEYRQLVKRFPTAPEAFEARERLGDLFLRLNDVEGALEAWRDQVAAAPDRAGADQAQLKIARALVDQGRLAEGRAAVSELLSRWPGSPLVPSASLISAGTFHLDGKHAEAVAAYKKVEAAFPRTAQAAEALFEQGNCLAELGDDGKAIQAFTAALVRHESPELVQFALERAQRRVDLARPVRPGNAAEVFDHGVAVGRSARSSVRQ